MISGGKDGMICAGSRDAADSILEQEEYNKTHNIQIKYTKGKGSTP